MVSHWEVETNSAVALMTGTFAALAANPQLSHGEALRYSMLAMINHPQQPNLVEPKYWAPFVVGKAEALSEIHDRMRGFHRSLLSLACPVLFAALH